MQSYEVLCIDLDETIYSKSNGIWRLITDRINHFMIDRLQIPLEDTQDLRQHYLDTYGTTLNGLLENYEVSTSEELLPVGLSEGCQLKKNIYKDQVITYHDVELPEARICDSLRKEQDSLFNSQS